MITHNLIEILTIIASVTTIIFIILNQPQSSDTYGTSGGMVQTRRGFEKQIHYLTVISSVALLLLVLAGQII